MNHQQLSLFCRPNPPRRSPAEILAAVRHLREFHAQGLLGGAHMPEDANPGLDRASRDNFHYFTLPMALNYQRNSYRLWEAALATYRDPATRFVFEPEAADAAVDEDLCAALAKYKVAVQRNRHPAIWKTICRTLVRKYEADVRTLFAKNQNDIALILEDVQTRQKGGFPYLCGPKIANYWLYVMTQYTDANLKNRCCLSVAPDTHVIQASIALGAIDADPDDPRAASLAAEAWRNILAGTEASALLIYTRLSGFGAREAFSRGSPTRIVPRSSSSSSGVVNA